MALMCPVNHPLGVGTTFCRLCGRTYIEVEDAPAPAALALLGAGPVARVETPPPFSLPEPPHAPPAVPAQAAPPPPPPPSAPPAAPVLPQVMPVPATLGVQVHLPLVEAPSEVKPSPTSTQPLDLGGPTLTAPEHDDAPSQVRRQLDRTAVLAGVLGGFVGGAVSGAAVTVLLG